MHGEPPNMLSVTQDRHRWRSSGCRWTAVGSCPGDLRCCTYGRRGGPQRPLSDTDVLPDPDNLPLRSRLFLVVPKTADAAAIEVRPST